MQSFKKLSFGDLNGWNQDDHDKALDVFSKTQSQFLRNLSPRAKVKNKSFSSSQEFFEHSFVPTLIDFPNRSFFTGYYEAEILGSAVLDKEFQFPIYKRPPDLKKGTKWLSRRELEESNILQNKSLEIVYLRSQVEVFLLQVQGSGRVTLTDGSVIRVGYDGRNGHEYISIGQILIKRGVFSAKNISGHAIKHWLTSNPQIANELLYQNPSYIFFKVMSDLGEESGPIGTSNSSLEEQRSIAVDPQYIPLGSPVWIEIKGSYPLNRLMVAQDTGSAIKGPSRVDIFFGRGDDAEKMAGQIKDYGRAAVFKNIMGS
ncbi:MAG: murein transglycosylase A [Paracoccaceae bacterium]